MYIEIKVVQQTTFMFLYLPIGSTDALNDDNIIQRRLNCVIL